MKVAMTLTDGQIETLGGLIPWTERDIDVPVPKEVFAEYGVTDTSITNKGKITFKMPVALQGTNQRGQKVGAIRTQDYMVREIVMNAKWQRPVYFAVTVAPDGRIGLSDYLRMEGLAYKFTPVRSRGPFNVYEPTLWANLFNEPQGFYREPHSGFKFRGLANPTIYFNDNDRGLMSNYRNAYMQLAMYYENTLNDTSKMVAAIDTMEKRIPRSIFPMDYRLLSDVARIYRYAGRKETYDALASDLETTCWGLINAGYGDPTEYYNPYRVLLEIYDERKDYGKEKEVLQRLQPRYPNDVSLSGRIRQLDSLSNLQSASVNPESSAAQPTKH
jgi:hypothetical protein